ncbi:hypothetical protein ACFX2I_021707 [Malus domestica]
MGNVLLSRFRNERDDREAQSGAREAREREARARETREGGGAQTLNAIQRLTKSVSSKIRQSARQGVIAVLCEAAWAKFKSAVLSNEWVCQALQEYQRLRVWFVLSLSCNLAGILCSCATLLFVVHRTRKPPLPPPADDGRNQNNEEDDRDEGMDRGRNQETEMDRVRRQEMLMDRVRRQEMEMDRVRRQEMEMDRVRRQEMEMDRVRYQDMGRFYRETDRLRHPVARTEIPVMADHPHHQISSQELNRLRRVDDLIRTLCQELKEVNRIEESRIEERIEEDTG